MNYSRNAVYSETEEEFENNIGAMIERGYAYGYENCLEWARKNAAERYKTETADRINRN
ncbi:MAG: hypothetical protein K6G60_06220 [Lachnospiraceae bacterium]|nr:hypothetical protein [Lachnospiraceae bacterium]